MRIDGAILDLDHTLFSPRSIPRAAFAPLIDAVRRANVGAAALPPERLELAFEAAWDHPFDEVARRHGLPSMLQEAWREAQRELRVRAPLEPYPDVASLAGLTVPLVLVTTGYRALQESKIEQLGLAPLFRAVHVDALDEPPRRPGKVALFRQILGEFGWTPAHVLVVGDSGESELAAGRELGMITVQVVRPGTIPWEAAQHRIASLAELASRFALGGPEPAA